MEPIFNEIANGFMVTLYKEKIITSDKTINVFTDNVTDKRISPILELIALQNKLSTSKLANMLGVCRMTILRDIEILKNKNVIKRVGSSKGGHWEIIE